jgi:hypothetical protein
MDVCKTSIPLKVEGKEEEKKKKGPMKKKQKRETCEAVIPIKQEGQKSNTDAWKFPKFHELLHIEDDMSRFGSQVNFCS